PSDLQVLPLPFVDPQFDRAAVRANLQVVFADPEAVCEPVPEPRFTLGEVYAFDAVRTPAGWRLARVEIRPVWKIGERPFVAA
ncbi:MAG: hypothetical protein REI11_16655, partial [Patulibacter sp.]|nr:hypothetical protein [Patulibacter sp.]